MQLVSLGASPRSANLAIEHNASRVTRSTSSDPIASRLLSRWRDLVASNTTLFLILLGVNALALPYAGLVHDARLYGIQVVNRVEGGSFDGDLYLRYGSQDRFTLFSWVAAPLVQLLGLRLAFFFIYLVSNAVFLWGTQRLVLALCEDRLLAALALVFLVTTHMTFAGLENFYVNESFVTPRLVANGLVLWGLAVLLEQHAWQALGFILLALAFHPLMACGGLVVYLAYLGSLRFSKWHILALVLALLSAAALMSFDSIAGRILGTMDGEWRDAVRRANPYAFPGEWALEDWLHILGALGIALAACTGALPGSKSRRLIACTAAVGVVGLVINISASQLFYALPIRGQGYRWLWLLQYLQVPCGACLLAAWWRQGAFATRAAAVVLAAYLGSLSGDRQQFLALLPFLAAGGFFLAVPPQSASRRAGLAACVLGAVWLIAYEAHALQIYWSKVAPAIDLLEYLRTAPGQLLAWTRWGLALLAVLGLAWVCRSRRAVGLGLVTAAVVVQAGYFSAAWAAETSRPAPGVALVRDYLARQARSENPTIYWPVGWVNYVWFDLHANSYYEPMQIAGNAFSRENAMEGNRRIRLVKRFELERVREVRRIYSPLQLLQLEDLYEAKLAEPAPTWQDVEALCADTQLDYLVLKQDFAGRYVANDGVWHLYDCNAIRQNRSTNSDHPQSAGSKVP